MLRPNAEVLTSWTSLNLTYSTILGRLLGRPQDVTKGRPQIVGKTRPLELNIRPYGDVLITSMGRPHDVGRGRPMALHKGPNGDIYRTFFGYLFKR